MTVLQRNWSRETQRRSRRGRKRYYLCVMLHLSQLHLFIPFPVPPVIKVHRQPHWLQEESAERHRGSAEVGGRAQPCAWGMRGAKKVKAGALSSPKHLWTNPSLECGRRHHPQRFAKNLLSPSHKARHCRGQKSIEIPPSRSRVTKEVSNTSGKIIGS